jgi:RNA-directed DNA polymerase
MENGVIDHPERGVPQGGCISPLLSNLYLHEVLDLWFEQEVKPRMRGRAFMVRFADDAVLGFEREDDARRVLDVLPKRLGTLWVDTAPGENAPGGLPPTRPATGGDATGTQLRHARLHPLLGALPEGALGGATQDGQVPVHPDVRRFNEWCRRNRHLPVAEQRRC